MTNSKHGGVRKGCGRRLELVDKERITVTLAGDDAERLRAWALLNGHASVSAAVRAMIDKQCRGYNDPRALANILRDS